MKKGKDNSTPVNLRLTPPPAGDKQPFRILIVTCMWNRPLVSELFALQLERLKNYKPKQFEIDCIAAVSETASENVCKKYNIAYRHLKNEPLATKWNGITEYAVRNYQFDYLLMMGDDDVMSNELLDAYLPMMKAEENYFGVKNIYFYKPGKALALLYEYPFECNKLVGAAKMLSREAVCKTGWRTKVLVEKPFILNGNEFKMKQQKEMPLYQARYFTAFGRCRLMGEPYFELFKRDLQSGLDGSMEENMIANGIMPQVVKLDTPLVTDVKTQQNRWQFSDFEEMSEYVSADCALEFFSEKERKFVNEKLMPV